MSGAARSTLCEEVRRTARAQHYDYYLASLLAPDAVQDDLMVLAAYFGEIERIPFTVSEPGIGEIRLQWWHDAITSGATTGNPLADRLNDLVRRAFLARDLLVRPIDELRHELYSDPLQDEDTFSAYVQAVENAHLTVRLHCMVPAPASSDLDAVRLAGSVMGQTRWLVRLPHLLARGRLLLPAARVPPSFLEHGLSTDNEIEIAMAAVRLRDEAMERWPLLRQTLQRLSQPVRMALLPAALAGPYLRALHSPSHDMLRAGVHVSELQRIVRLWLAARMKVL